MKQREKEMLDRRERQERQKKREGRPRVGGFFTFLDYKEKGEVADFLSPEAALQVAIGFANAT